jgi:hypothetical protein
MRSGWSLWQNPRFLEVYAKGHGWTLDEVDGVHLLVSSKRWWSKRATVNADEVGIDPARIWGKYPNAIIKTYTPIPGCASTAENQGTYLLNLEQDYQERFNKSCRVHIRRSLESEQHVQVAEDEDQLREWFRLYLRAGEQINFKTKTYDVVLPLFNSPYSQLYTTHLNGELTAGLFILVDGDVAMEWIGATDKRFSKDYPNSLLHIKALNALAGRVKTYDFGGVIKDTGIDQFKRGFGGTYLPLYIYRRPAQ